MMDAFSFLAGAITIFVLRMVVDIFYNEIKAGLLKLPSLGQVACRLGVHRWHYYYKNLGSFGFICRNCNRCQRIQHLNGYNDSNTWIDVKGNLDQWQDEKQDETRQR